MTENAAEITTDYRPPTSRTTLPHWKLIVSQAGITDEVRNYTYPGSGTQDDPFLVHWIPNDPRNPQEFRLPKKWLITVMTAFSLLAVSLASSAYSSGSAKFMAAFNISQEVATLGLSLFVLGFAIGPLIAAPLSEVFGRQILFTITYFCFVMFNIGATCAQNSWSLIILRFFAGSFGSTPMANAGGVISDMFGPSERGLAMSIFAAAPFLGPALGPIIGGFLIESASWRWLLGFITAFAGVCFILVVLLVPETYAPVLLRQRARALSKETNLVYISKLDHEKPVLLGEQIKIALSRPWLLLFREPIVLLMSIHLAIVFGTLYLFFGAYPIVYRENRHWSSGISGLAFLGILIGMIAAVLISIWDSRRYSALVKKHNGVPLPPEARLPLAMVGGVLVPIAIFWFAWTNSPSIHWMVSIVSGVPFGLGMVTIVLGEMNYLVDSYTFYAASVLAGSAVLRSLFGASFPLFTSVMYDNLGIHWASSIPAFLSLACVPFPILFYRYGPAIRTRCHYSAQSAEFMRKLAEK